MTSRSHLEKKLRQRWLEVLRAELDRRDQEDGGASREQRIAELQAQLDVMAERIRAAPDYVEPSEAQKAQWGRELDAFFRSYASRARR